MLTTRTFLAPKKGEEIDDCQDSVHPSPAEVEAGNHQIYAVSDGTTTSFFSRVWSTTLTGHFADNPDQAFSDWDMWLRDAQKKWEAEIGQRARADSASFFTRNGFHARRPAAATFAALVLGETFANETTWRALVLGDSCIFFLPASGQSRVINLQASAEFSSVVQTVESWPNSDPHRPIAHESSPAGLEPTIMDRDAVLLASDALSKWLLLREERNRPVWGAILRLNSDSEFADLIANARAESDDALENDDVALVVLKFGEPHPVYEQQHFEPNRGSQPASHVLLRSFVDPAKAEQPIQLTTPKFLLSNPQAHLRRTAVLFALGILLLGASAFMNVSQKHALAGSRGEQRRLSAELRSAADEKAALTNLADNYRTQWQDTLRKLGDTERNSAEDRALQWQKFEFERQNYSRKLTDLQQQVTALKERLPKSVAPPDFDDAPSSANK